MDTPPLDIVTDGGDLDEDAEWSDAAAEDHHGVSLAVESPGTFDDLTEKPRIPAFTYRMAAFSDGDYNWFKKIMMYGPASPAGTDTLDAQTSAAEPVEGINRQVSAYSIHKAGKEESATNAFGQFLFRHDDIPAWFVRLSTNTSQEDLQELMETKFEVINAQRPLRIHFIDYDRPLNIPQFDWTSSSEAFQRSYPHRQQDMEMQKLSIDPVSKRLYRDIRSMCRKTAGLVMTWSGLVYGPGRYIHEALEALYKEPRLEAGGLHLASVVVPPWSILPYDLRSQLIDCTAEREPVTLPPRFDEKGGLGPVISTASTHYLLLDDAKEELSSWVDMDSFYTEHTSRLTVCRHFQQRLIMAMENYREAADMPVVCVLMGGGVDSLKMVRFALERQIPVLVMKGTGGVADMIADVYTRAESVSEKYRDEQRKVQIRTAKLSGRAGQYYLHHFPYGDKTEKRKRVESLLKYIFDHLDTLTIYCPTFTVQSLDSAIFEALLKNKQITRIRTLVDVMQQIRSVRRSTSTSETGAFIDSEMVQMDLFIEAIRQNSVEIVRIFMEQLKLSYRRHFHMGRILRLYTPNAATAKMMSEIRQDLKKLLKKLAVFPLRCLCDDCPSCNVNTNTMSKESELLYQRTCLHPIQELFLWSVCNRQIDMAVVFWKRCDDKIAAALVAHTVLKSLSKSKDDPDIKWQIREDMERFQSLAVQTLKSCHEMDEILTEALLTKPCPWWGGLSILQIAIASENRSFLAQTACKNVMTCIWQGDLPRQPRKGGKGPCRLVDVPTTKEAGSNCVFWHPKRKYFVNLVLQFLFLLLFSFMLLTDLVGPSVEFGVLGFWVLAITVEELRQLFARNPVTSEIRLSRQHQSFRRKWKTYSRQYWNILDMASILLFVLGLMAMCPIKGVHIAGRVLLSVDVFLFFMRTFQMLMVFEDLGLLLYMVLKMVKDTINFMIILLVFVLAYAISSESLLYPETEITGSRLFYLPRKAYWQVFGDVFLEEIQHSDEESCSKGNDSMHYGGTQPHCPTEYGSYIVPVFLGIYMMITHVLLLNLLIARFNKTFDKVYNEAVEHQAWQRCDIITEFYCRSSLPPPFNLMKFVFVASYKIIRGFWRFCVECCRARPSNCNSGTPVTSPLLPGEPGEVVFTRSADLRSLDVFWDQSLSPAHGSELYSVCLTESDDWGNKKEEIFKVAKLEANGLRTHYKKQAFTIWDLNPDLYYSVKVENREARDRPNTTVVHFIDTLKDIREFEEKEMRWVMDQEARSPDNEQRTSVDGVTAGLNEVRTSLGQVMTDSREIRERTDTMLTDINTVKDSVDKSLKTLEDRDKDLKKALSLKKKVAKDLQSIAEFIQDNSKEARKEAEEARTEADTARRDLQRVTAQLERAGQEVLTTHQQLEQCRAQLETTQTALAQAKAEEQTAREQAASVREQAFSQLKEMRDTLSDTKATTASAASQVEGVKRELTAVISSLSQLAGMKDIAEEARSQASTSVSELAALRDTVQQILTQQQEHQQQQQQQLQQLLQLLQGPQDP